MKLKKIKNKKIQVEYENRCQVFGLAVIELDTKEEKEVAIYLEIFGM